MMDFSYGENEDLDSKLERLLSELKRYFSRPVKDIYWCCQSYEYSMSVIKNDDGEFTLVIY